MKGFRLLPLIVGIVTTSSMIVLSVTPIAWRLSGKIDESYPELIFLLYGTPGSLVVFLSGLMLFLFGRRGRARSLQVLWASFILSFLALAFVLSAVFFPIPWLSDAMVGKILNHYLLAGLPALILSMIVGAGIALRANKAADD